MLEKEKVKKCIQKLRTFKGTIVVEGKKDKNALKQIGVKANICTIKSSNLSVTNYAIALGRKMQKKNQKVLILTDFDEEGNKLAKSLMNKLQHWDVEVDRETRALLKSYLKKDITTIESLPTLKLEFTNKPLQSKEKLV